MHPYYTERGLARCDGLAQVAERRAHHERSTEPATTVVPPGHLRRRADVAAADVCQAMGEPRPHRPAHTASQIARSLDNDVVAGRLDGDVVAAVLRAAGMRTGGAPRGPPGCKEPRPG